MLEQLFLTVKILPIPSIKKLLLCVLKIKAIINTLEYPKANLNRSAFEI